MKVKSVRIDRRPNATAAIAGFAKAAVITCLLSALSAPGTASADSKRRAYVVFHKEMPAGASHGDMSALAVKTSQARDVIQNLGLNVVNELPLIEGFTVRLKDREANMVAEELSKLGMTLERDAKTRAFAIPNDTFFAQNQSYLANGPTAMSAVWDYLGSKTMAKVVVGDLDTGVTQNHNDLSGNVSANGMDALTNTPGSAAADDVHGHGTHVAGIIAGKYNNSTGVSGVMGPFANDNNILPIQVLGDNGSGSLSAIVTAIDHLIARKNAGDNVRVANLSLGANMSSCPSYLAQAFDKGIANGILFAIAAGNSKKNAVYSTPANCSRMGVVVVAATDPFNNNVRASFSNYGKIADFGAPGVSIMSTLPNGQYAAWSGTSMATPYVAGVAALMFSLNPHWTPAIVHQQLRLGVTPVKSLGSGYTLMGGVLNPAKALDITDIYPEVSVAGTVVNNLNGQPVAGVTVTSPVLGTTTTNASGQFSFPAYPTSVSTALTFSKTGWVLSPTTIKAASVSKFTNLTVKGRQRFTVTGSVTDGTNPLAAALVYVCGYKTYTNASGQFAVPNIYEGTNCSISARPIGYSCPLDTSVVSASQGARTATCSGYTPKAYSATIGVYFQKLPVSAQVVLKNYYTNATVATGNTSNGKVTFSNLPAPGVYRVTITGSAKTGTITLTTKNVALNLSL